MTATTRTQLTGEARKQAADEAAELYRNGASIRDIVEATGRSYGTVHRLLWEHPDVTFRPRGGATRKP